MSLLLLFGRRADTLALTDTVSLLDSIARQPSKQTADTVSLAESLAKNAARALAETLALADSVTRTAAKLAADAVSLADSLLKSTAHGLSDLLGLSELLAYGRQLSLPLADSLALADALAKTAAKRLADALTLAEACGKSIARTMLAEALILSDSLTRASAKAFSHVIALTDALAKTAGKRFAETLTLAESFSFLRDFGRYGRHLLAQFWARLLSANAPARRVAAEALSRLWSATELMIYCDPKDPESVEDFQIDWTAVLASDTITASSWEIPSGLTSVAASFTSTLATVRLSGGVAGQNYVLKNVVTLASGRVLPQPLLLPVAV